jgi:hypothetical protein
MVNSIFYCNTLLFSLVSIVSKLSMQNIVLVIIPSQAKLKKSLRLDYKLRQRKGGRPPKPKTGLDVRHGFCSLYNSWQGAGHARRPRLIVCPAPSSGHLCVDSLWQKRKHKSATELEVVGGDDDVCKPTRLILLGGAENTAP